MPSQWHTKNKHYNRWSTILSIIIGGSDYLQVGFHIWGLCRTHVLYPLPPKGPHQVPQDFAIRKLCEWMRCFRTSTSFVIMDNHFEWSTLSDMCYIVLYYRLIMKVIDDSVFSNHLRHVIHVVIRQLLQPTITSLNKEFTNQ